MMFTNDNTAQVQTEPDRTLTSTSTRFVQRKCACGGTTGISDTCADCNAEKLSIVQRTFSNVVQRHLAVSQPHDSYEQEADQVADEVMRTPESNGRSIKFSPPSIQRMCTDCEEEEQVQRQPEEEENQPDQSLQGKGESGAIGRTGEVAQSQTAEIESLKAGGESLPATSLDFFGQRFGHDFSSVRVHSDDRAAQSARALQALAYTTGQHIVFGAGQYSPETRSGQKLLAHELTHVIQQNGGQEIRRQEDEHATPAEETSTDTSGIIAPDIQELPEGLSIKTSIGGPAPEPGATEPSAPEEQAMVSRLATSESATNSEPEQQAISESPYPTGMGSEQLRSSFGSGQRLDADVRTSYECRYGHSLDHVRIHADRQAHSLCERFGAEAFTFDNHIAFREQAYSPRTPAGEKILRHELTHVLRSPVSPTGIFRVPAACTTNCPASGAHAFTPFASTSVNCYGYAKNFPPSGFLDPGEPTSTAEFTRQNAVRFNPASSASDLSGILPYFTPAGVRRNTEADLGSPISSDCTVCCFGSNRKIIAVAADPATRFARLVVGGTFRTWLPMVTDSLVWDFHWYRKDADRSWSHKHGGGPAQRNDESGTTPICNPCNADRNFTPGSVNYNNVIGSWCV